MRRSRKAALRAQAGLTTAAATGQRPALMEQSTAIEAALRGAGAGVNLLLLVRLAFSGAPSPQRPLAIAFVVCTISYILVSGQAIPLAGVLEAALVIGAIFHSVVFWWFALSLFDDDFRWTPLKIAPFALLALLHAPFPPLETHPVVGLAHGAFAVGLPAHAVFIALRDFKADLVDPRRQFRVAFAAVVGLTGAAIGVVEVIFEDAMPPSSVMLFHAGALAALSVIFCAWLLTVNEALFATAAPPPAPPVPPDLRPTRLIGKLDAAMAGGAYREAGLTVGALASQIGLAEHQLRRLINQELGFRNFAAFLNERRIADAKSALADPDRAHETILQIALDVGFGSIAPFNRAFKLATGVTPTEFRRQALAGRASPA